MIFTQKRKNNLHFLDFYRQLEYIRLLISQFKICRDRSRTCLYEVQNIEKLIKFFLYVLCD